MNNIREFIITAKRKSKRGKDGDAAKRSRLLKAVMPHVSGDQGKALADAIESKDLGKFKDLWSKATNGIITQLEKEFNVDKAGV